MVALPRSIAERVKREAEKLGVSLEEYLIELLVQSLDPSERAQEYTMAAEELLKEAEEELKKGSVRQAAEKVWGAAALAIKAYAAWREGRRLTSHGELWEYKRRLEKELGDWVSDAWYAGQAMHVCFYEGWCAREDVEKAIRRVEKLVEAIAKKVLSEDR